jgi:hypothetical protein
MSFQKLFMESKGQPIRYKGKELKMVDRINLQNCKISLKVNFVSTESNLRQGIVIQTKGDFDINGQKLSTKIILWENTAPNEIEFFVNSKDKVLVVHNVWETEDGTVHYWHNGGALYLEVTKQIRTYYCNDGYPDDDFNDLIFTNR